MKDGSLKRGDIILANLDPVKGSEQGGIRPVLVLQNNEGNKFSPTTIVTSITSKKFTKEFPTNVFISQQDSNLDRDSTIMLNQIKTIDKSRIIKKISSLDFYYMNKVNLALKVSLELP